MSKTMNLLISTLLISGGFDWHSTWGLIWALSFLLVIVSVSTLKRRRFWRFAAQRLSGQHARDWSLVPATVDVVSVVSQTEPIRGYAVEAVGYLVTLTYFYRNPEMQTGDFSRMFDCEEDAQAWASSIKGRTVMVRVDPRDPSHSVLRFDDLQTVMLAKS